MKPGLKNFSGVKRDPDTGEEYVIHKPSGVVYLLRKPIGDLDAIRKQTDGADKRPKQRKLFPKLARATFIEGSEPKGDARPLARRVVEDEGNA